MAHIPLLILKNSSRFILETGTRDTSEVIMQHVGEMVSDGYKEGHEIVLPDTEELVALGKSGE